MEDNVQYWLYWWLKMRVGLFLSFFLVNASSLANTQENSTTNNSTATLNVQLRTSSEKVVINNDILQITFANPTGDVVGIKYKGIDNVLEILNEEDNRGYWDVVWNKPGNPITYDKLACTKFNVIGEDDDQVEVSFSKKWDVSLGSSFVPLNVDKRYIVRRGSSGIYMYTILERLKGWPDVDMDQIRVVFKLQQRKFHYMAMTNQRQRTMPMPQDRLSGQPLAYPEAVLLTHPTNPDMRGEVDDKYQYSCEDKDNRVHGWISDEPPVGFWMISPSDEFRVGGPMKQDLTSHVGPTVLNMFTSTHYAGKDMNTAYRNGEPWKKVFGPVFLYLNSAAPDDDVLSLWNDAKRQMYLQVKTWPYSFPKSNDFPKADQRGRVGGHLLVRDPYISEKLLYASFAYVGLAAPGVVGSWQTEVKGYQFWTQTNRKGQFLIPNVRPGNYNLYAWVPGILGEYKCETTITVLPGSKVKLGVLTFYPPRSGPTLWEIGVPDRTAAEFYVPDTYPTLMNKLYINQPTDKFRQYGLWERYNDLYPRHDLVYDVKANNYSEDWFFAHVTRNEGNGTYRPTTWQIIFYLNNLSTQGIYTLRLALASATASELIVRVNDPKAIQPLFTTGLIGKDNAIARHGIHGLHWLFSVDVPGHQLVEGSNSIYITQSRGESPFHGVMYDYIRLEGPRDN